MTTEIEKQELVEILKGARTVDFTTTVLETMKKRDLVEQDSKSGDKAAKAYLESVNFQFRTQMQFLYNAVAQAFPEDDINPRYAFSSLGPQDLLEQYEFKVIVAKK
jgi:hypothetical protein